MTQRTASQVDQRGVNVAQPLRLFDSPATSNTLLGDGVLTAYGT
ncbi:hypothetical protein [Kitasatospora sp. NPDC058046]